MTDENDGDFSEEAVVAVPPEMAGGRLDSVLAGLRPDLSRAFIRKLLDAGDIAVDGVAAKPSLKVRGGETARLRIPRPRPLSVAAEDIPLSVLYEDGDVIVVDKPPGMVAHPSQGHGGGTLVNALLHHYGDSLSGIGGVLRPGIVHRLDKDTSGCLCAAKNDNAHRSLMRQFMDREVEKVYLAITEAPPRPLEGKVEGNIGRSVRDRKRHAMLKTGGRHSLTLYSTLENYGTLALVRCRLMTGRTHQARVHLASVGAPILCDRDYGRRETYTRADARNAVSLYRRGEPDRGGGEGIVLARQALHASELEFAHPVSGERLHFTAPLPADMTAVLEPLRRARAEMEKE